MRIYKGKNCKVIDAFLCLTEKPGLLQYGVLWRATPHLDLFPNSTLNGKFCIYWFLGCMSYVCVKFNDLISRQSFSVLKVLAKKQNRGIFNMPQLTIICKKLMAYFE